MTSAGPRVQLAEHAARSHGVVSVTSALDLGVTRGQLRAAVQRGDWHTPARGVLVAAGAPRSWYQDCAIAAMSSGGKISHRAAARLHRLDGFTESPVELTIPADRHWPSLDAVVHRSGRLHAPDVLTIEGIPVTSIARTLVDLGSVVDDDAVEQALDDALRRGVSLRWICQTLERVERPGRSGSGALRRVLSRPDRRGPLPDSTFERLLERVCVETGLPRPDRQVAVIGDDGHRIAVLDVAWPDCHLAVEAHSERWHAGAGRGRNDQLRDNRLAALGWELLYASWADVQRPDEFAAMLVAAYDLRRPPGEPPRT